MPRSAGERRFRSSDMRSVALRARTVALAIARPCTCGRVQCTVGEHVLRAMRDSESGAGLRAQSFEPNRSRSFHGGINVDEDRHPDSAHADLAELAARVLHDSETILRKLSTWHPDRWRDDNMVNDDTWCRHHLDQTMVCEPRFQGDECRRCYDFRRANGTLPTGEILAAWHRGSRVTTDMVSRAKQAARQQRRRKKKTKR